MSKLLILGAGQYGLVAREVAEAMGVYDRIEFLDDANPIAVGRLSDLDAQEYDAAFVAIGNSEVRSHYVQQIQRSGKNLACLVHPRAAVAASAAVGAGCIVEAGAVISSNARIGRACIIMANVVIGHDAVIGNCCLIKYNSTIAERAVVPDGTLVRYHTVWEE